MTTHMCKLRLHGHGVTMNSKSLVCFFLAAEIPGIAAEVRGLAAEISGQSFGINMSSFSLPSRLFSSSTLMDGEEVVCCQDLSHCNEMELLAELASLEEG